MFNRNGLAIFMLIGALVVGSAPVFAQDSPDATPFVALNMRAGPGTTYAVIGVLQPTDSLILEARNGDTSWVLGHTPTGALRGWVAAIYLKYRDGFAASRLPVGEETIAGGNPTSADSVPVPAASASGYIVIPGRAYDILAQGIAKGNNPGGFVKVGDSNAESTRMLAAAFEAGQYDLGPYIYLEPTIAFFRDGGSFRHFHASAHGGLSVLAVQDPMYRPQQYCGQFTGPLECDFNALRPSVAFVFPMAGDVYGLTDYEYAAGLRQIVAQCVERGTVPVLVTWPLQHRVGFINSTVRAVAGEFGVPLIDFANAAESLPNRGTQANDVIHLTGTDFMSFNGDETRYGYALLNLLALQTLDQLTAGIR
jgi:uncharacterized protein YraI